MKHLGGMLLLINLLAFQYLYRLNYKIIRALKSYLQLKKGKSVLRTNTGCHSKLCWYPNTCNWSSSHKSSGWVGCLIFDVFLLLNHHSPPDWWLAVDPSDSVFLSSKKLWRGGPGPGPQIIGTFVFDIVSLLFPVFFNIVGEIVAVSLDWSAVFPAKGYWL